MQPIPVAINVDIHTDVISTDDLPQEVDLQIPSNNDPLEENKPQTSSIEAMFEKVGPEMESTDELPEETEDQMDFDSNTYSPPHAMDICQPDSNLEIEPSSAIVIRAEENVVLEVQDNDVSRQIVFNVPLNLNPRALLDMAKFGTRIVSNIVTNHQTLQDIPVTRAEDSTTMISMTEVSC